MRNSIILLLLVILAGCGGVEEEPMSDRIMVPPLAAAGGSSPYPWHHSFTASGPLVYRAEATWTGRAAEPIHATLTMENPSSVPVQVETGPCGLGLRAFATSRITDIPIWDDRPPPRTACADLGIEINVPPGGQETFAIHELMRHPYESLPPRGAFHLAVVFHDDDGMGYLVPAGEIRVTGPGPDEKQ